MKINEEVETKAVLHTDLTGNVLVPHRPTLPTAFLVSLLSFSHSL